MRRKTIIISTWLITILLAFGLGGFVGTKIGIKCGQAEVMNRYTWCFCTDLYDISLSVEDPETRFAIANLPKVIQSVCRTNYSEALENYKESLTDNANANFKAILSKTIIPGLETQNCTVREAFRNLEQQANSNLDEDQHLVFILDDVPVESACNDHNVISSLVTPIRQISVLDAIRLLSEVFGVQFTLVPHSRHIIIKKNASLDVP